MTAITHTPVTLTDHEETGNLYSVTIFANELSRDGVSVDIDGMDFSNYRKNPVVLFAHDYSGRTESSGLPIGRTVGLDRTPDGRIRADFEFLSGDPFADRVRNAWNRGFLRAASIGWKAIEARPNDRGRGLRIVKSELIEWSIVAVPADPDALRSAYTRVMKALIDETAPSSLTLTGTGVGKGVQTDVNTNQRPPLPQSLPRTRCGGEGWGEGENLEHLPLADPSQIDLTETRTLLETLSRTVRPDSAHPEFCRDPPGERAT